MVHRWTLLALGLASLPAAAGTLTVTSTTPARNATNIAGNTTISVTFDRALQTGSVTASSFRVNGRMSGPIPGTRTFSNANQTVTWTGSRPFKAGDLVTVNLANTLTAADASPLRQGGFAFQFTVETGSAQRIFDPVNTYSVRTTPGSGTRLYGASAVDLDMDGWVDLATVNEDSGDVRVLMNSADTTGYDPFLQPPPMIGLGGSPNEAGDFNNDGKPDVATANYAVSTVSILLGDGDGTFAPEQSRSVGSTPHGLAALDVDGDADLDLVTANEGANNLSLLLNNGSGSFGAATNFEGGGSGEYPVAAADMNNDGIFDLVVGTRNDQQVHVLLGNGNGTFTHHSNRAGGGLPWMIQLGDVNGDGNVDVSMANGQSNNGSILLGNGDGTLQAAQTYLNTGHMVATDLGDLDGDGDLDWVLSSFGAGEWYVLVNNGAGAFTLMDTIPATNNASCAFLLDFDDDGDLDVSLFDEIADEIKLLRNRSSLLFGDGFETGNTSAWTLTQP